MELPAASAPNGAVLPVQPAPSDQAAESAQPMQLIQHLQQTPLGAAPAIHTSAPILSVSAAQCAVPPGYIPPPSASPGASMAQPSTGMPVAAQPPSPAQHGAPGSSPQAAWPPGVLGQAGMPQGSMPPGGLPAGVLPPGALQPGTLHHPGATGRPAMPMPPGMSPGGAVPGPGGNYIVGAVTTRLTVTVPAGICGGELVRVAAPDGSYHSVMVPAGLSAGQQFSVRADRTHSACKRARKHERTHTHAHTQAHAHAHAGARMPLPSNVHAHTSFPPLLTSPPPSPCFHGRTPPSSDSALAPPPPLPHSLTPANHALGQGEVLAGRSNGVSVASRPFRVARSYPSSPHRLPLPCPVTGRAPCRPSLSIHNASHPSFYPTLSPLLPPPRVRLSCSPA
jgi:hypothetical protein